MKKVRYSAVILMTLLIASLFYGVPISHSSDEKNGWLTFNTGVITVAIPRNGSIPLYFWWYNYDNKTIYVANYFGLAEVWIPLSIKFRHKYMFKDEANISKQIIERFHELEFIKPEVINRIEYVETEAMETLAKITIKPSTAYISSLNKILRELKTINATEIKDIISQIKIRIAEIIDLIKEFEEASPQEKKDIANQIINKVRDIEELFKELKNTIREKMITVGEIMRRLGEAIKEMHPFFLPFAACKWELIPPENITDSEGRVIGVEFGFILKKAPKPFDFTENNVIIRNRMYYVTVNETVNNINYTLTRAELKSDIIIKKWVWNLDILKLYLGDYREHMPLLTPNLILMSMFKIGYNVSNNTVNFMSNIYNNVARGGGLILTSKTIIKHRGEIYKYTGEVEEEIDVKLPKLIMTTNETTVAGFFRFIPNATVTYPNGTETNVDVYGVFLLTTKHLFVSLVYPYFNGGKLQHDPIFGVEGVPIKEEKASYVVSIGDTGVERVKSAEELAQATKPIINYTTLAALAIIVTLAVIIALAYRRK